MSQSINILHISDFHLTRKWQSLQDSVATAFKTDVSRLSDGITKPDIIVVTGDLANAADDDDIYGAFLDKLLAEITDITKCSDRRVFFCPGNHDAHRSALREHSILALHRELQEKLKKSGSIAEEFETGRLADLASAKFRAFNELESIIASEQRRYSDGISTVYRVPESSCHILSINTAVMTSAGLEGVNDERSLFIPEESISSAIASISGEDPIIAIMHHPLSWLSEENEVAVRLLLERRCNMQLFGHVHHPRPSQVTSVSGNLMLSQAGALYAGRSRYNGYGILCHDLLSHSTTAVLRTYFEKRDSFDEATDIVAKGLFHSSQDARANWSRKSKAIDIDKFRGWLKDEKHKELKSSFNAGLVDKPLCDVFVSPPMFASAPSVQTDLETQAVEVEEAIKLNDVINSAANYTFFGKQEYGKTSLLRQIAYQTLCRAEELDRPRLPIVIAFDDLTTTLRRIEKLILSALQGVNPPFDLEQILTDGLVCLLVDDVNFADARRLGVLRSFIDRFPKNRYIFSSAQQEGERFSATATLDVSVTFRNVTLNHFSRRDMRQLVEKWDNNERLDRESILNRLSKELANINVPFTAVNGSILLSIYEQQSNFTPINRAVLVERFIEVLLEKRSLQDAARKTFDFRNKAHLLAHLSEIMARGDKYVIDYQDVVDIFDKYFVKMGLNQSGKVWVEQFVQCRILAPRADERVSFRYRAFLEYFIASRMDDDATFRDWVMEEERYLSYINEIQYFAGKVRTDQRLLDLIGERFLALTQSMLSGESVAADLRFLETFQLPDPKRSKDILAELEAQWNLPQLSAAERDEILDGEIPKDVEGRQEVFRPATKDLGTKWMVGLLLYSGILKNLELIDDGVKRRHLRAILHSWGLFTTASLSFVPLVAKNRKMRINGVQYEVLVPKSMSDAEAARLIYLGLPNAIGKLLFSVLGTEKLERQLLEPELLEATDAKILEFYKLVLIVGLRLGNWDRAVSRFIPDLSKARYLSEAVAWWLIATYRMSETAAQLGDTLRRLASEAISSVKGKTDADRKKIKARQIQRLKQRDLLRSMQLSLRDESLVRPTSAPKNGKKR